MPHRHPRRQRRLAGHPDVFALHVAGRTKVIYETRPLGHVNEAISEVQRGKAKARLVLRP